MVPKVPKSASPVRTPALLPYKARPFAFRALLTPPKAPPKPTAKPFVPPNPPTKAPDPERTERRRQEESSSSKPEIDPVDPTLRLSAQLAPPVTTTAFVAPAAPAEQRARVSLEELVPHVLRRIAWGGDRVKGAVFLELTSGHKVTVHAEGRRVSVTVDGDSDLERRISSRLRAAGIEVEGVG